MAIPPNPLNNSSFVLVIHRHHGIGIFVKVISQTVNFLFSTTPDTVD